MSKRDLATVEEGKAYVLNAPHHPEVNLDKKLKDSYPEGFMSSKKQKSSRKTNQSKKK